MPIPSPFHPRTSKLCTSLRWKDWAGYHAVRSYSTYHEREYFAFRHAAGLMDVTPLFKYDVSGRDAAAFLARVMVKDINKLQIGQVAYCCWCDDAGKVLDDGTVWRLGEHAFRATAAEPNLSWFHRNAHGFDVSIEDTTGRIAAASLQGPNARAILGQVTDADVAGLGFFRLTDGTVDGRAAVITRTGYTGDLGYEIWVANDDAVPLWDALLAAGAPYGIEPAGLDALDNTRVEAGFIMNGVDYYSANHCLIESRKSTPYEIALGWTVNLDRDPFNGQAALAAEKARGPARRFVGLELDWDEYEALFARHGLPPNVCSSAWRDPVPVYTADGAQVGQATSGSWSPSLKKNLALATVESPHGEIGERLRMEVTVEYERRSVTATVARKPFFDPPEETRLMARRYDAIVVGGGHNGLVCAAYLARAGRSVLVLERRHVLGGAAVTEELHPGFHFSVCSYVVSLFRPHIIRELGLARHGMEQIPLECSFLPLPGGDSLCRGSDPHETRREIARFSRKDADLYPEFGMAMSKMAHFAKRLIDAPAPDPASLDPREIMRLLRLGRAFRGLGPDLMHLNMQLLTMSAVDFLDLWFESAVLKAPMSVSGIIGTFLGVRSPGTAYVLLHHYMGEIDGAFRSWGFSKGGTGRVSLAIASAARGYGCEIRTEAPVERVLLRDGRAEGVVLEGGEEIAAKTVVSALDPRRTFLRMVGAEHLEPAFVTQIERYKMRGSSGKVNLAVDRLPDFVCRPGPGPHLRGDIAIAPGIDYLERAYDEAKYGAYSRRPYLNVVIPSIVDPSVAPPGKHIVSCFVQYAPYHIEGGANTWPDHREAFGDTVVDTLAEYCPGLKESILYRQVLTPWDLEQEFGLTEGNIFHGELSPEQLLFQRPATGWARYRTPIRGLWMCASGTHPGGGVMGAPGELAAKTMLGTGGV